MDKQRSAAFMLKMVGDVATTLAANLLIVGDRLGLFTAMAGAGPLDASGLADRAGIDPRHAHEWLCAMASAGYLAYDPQTDRFELPEEHAIFLADPTAETYLGGLFASLPMMATVIPQLTNAFRDGTGISFADFGEGLPMALGAMNRSVYESRLVKSWLPSVPGAIEKLQAGGRFIDVGCGIGIVPLAVARAFPQAQVLGLDLDARSIETARAHAQAAGVAVEFRSAGVEALPMEQPWDVITSFDVIHDLPDPPGALQRIRQALAPDGVYLMVEPKAGDSLEQDTANPFGRMLRSMSCLHCVPQSLAAGGTGLGACWGEKRARAMAAEAGFTAFERLDVRSPAMSFYALRAQ